MYDDYEKIKQELENGTAQIFDVREEDEWEAGHLTNAHLAPLSGLKENTLPSNITKLDKEKKTYLHCRSGRRVLTAQPLLEELGFKEVIALESGYEILVDEGFDFVEE